MYWFNHVIMIAHLQSCDLDSSAIVIQPNYCRGLLMYIRGLQTTARRLDEAREALSSGPWRPFCLRKKITEIYVYPAKISRRLRGRYVFTELK